MHAGKGTRGRQGHCKESCSEIPAMILRQDLSPIYFSILPYNIYNITCIIAVILKPLLKVLSTELYPSDSMCSDLERMS